MPDSELYAKLRREAAADHRGGPWAPLPGARKPRKPAPAAAHPSVPDDLPTRSLGAIMRLVRKDWTSPYFGAVPYIDALAQLEDIDEWYLAETGRQLVPYFLANAGTWRGPTARAVKSELKRRLAR